MKYEIRIDQYGAVRFYNAFGKELTDPKKIRQLKATANYRTAKGQLLDEIKQEKDRASAKASLERQKQKELDARAKAVAKKRQLEIGKSEVDYFNATVDNLSKIHTMAADVRTAESIREVIDSIKREREELLGRSYYVKKVFDKQPPTESDARKILQSEAELRITSLLFKKSKQEKYVAENLQSRLIYLNEIWANEKKRFDENEEKVKRERDAEIKARLDELDETPFEQALAGDEQYIREAVKESFDEIDLPNNPSYQFEFDANTGTARLDLYIPSIDTMPEQKAFQKKSGEVSYKPITKTEKQELYAGFALGLSVLYTSYVLDVSPVIQKVVTTGYTKSETKLGTVVDKCIYSFEYERKSFEDMDLSTVALLPFCTTFEHRFELSATYLFKEVTPL